MLAVVELETAVITTEGRAAVVVVVVVEAAPTRSSTRTDSRGSATRSPSSRGLGWWWAAMGLASHTPGSGEDAVWRVKGTPPLRQRRIAAGDA